MWHLTQLALSKRAVTLSVALLLAVASVWAFLGLKTELLPAMEFPYTTVVTVYPGASPDSVVNDVTMPIEKVVQDAWAGKGLKRVTSTSTDSFSVVFAEFEFGTDMKTVTSSINQGLGKLSLPPAVAAFSKMNPAGGDNPRVVPINMSMLPMVTLSLSGDLRADQLKSIADTQVVPGLKSIKGVLSVEVQGGDKDQVVITPDIQKMNEHGVSMSQIVSLLAPKYDSVAAVGKTFIAAGSTVNLEDIATVTGPQPMSAITRTDGKPSVVISVMKDNDSNIVEVANAVVAKADNLSGSLGTGVTLSPVFDQSDFIEGSISQLWEKALIGGVLAIAVVFLFLWAARASLVTAISIPLSMLFAFLGMRLSGITINLLTLSAMSIAVGRLIDDSIVIVEVIFRRLQRGESFGEAAIGGPREVATPITAATLATVAIFVPLMFVGGIVGELFVPFALTVTFAMLASLLVALMVVPALSWLLVTKKAKAESPKESWYGRLYVSSLRTALAHRVITLVVAGALFVGSLGLLPVIGTSFMSGMSEKTLTVGIQTPPGSDVRAASEAAVGVEALLSRNSNVRTFYTRIGSSSSLAGAMTALAGNGNAATISVYLVPNVDMEKEAAALRLALKAVPGNETMTVSVSDSGGGMGMAASGVDVSVQGENQEDVAKTAAVLAERLKAVKGLANIESDITMVVPTLKIGFNPARAAASGLPAAQMQQLPQEFQLLMAGGALPNQMTLNNNESYSLYIKPVTRGLQDVALAQNLKVGWPKTVALSDVADVTLLQRPTHVSRTDLALSASVKATVTDRDVGSVNGAVQKVITALPAHPGVDVKIAGIAEEMSSTFSRMGIAIIAAIVIAFLVVVLMMRSLINPIIIMASLPLAAAGALLGLLVSGHTLGLSAMMGMMMLVGIVLTNAIVLIAIVEQLRKEGMSVHDALIEGGRTRLRPILMTALTTIFAMVPLALGAGAGTFLAAELAVVVIGGMFTSTALTLMVIPVLYSMAHRSRGNLGAQPKMD